MFKKAGMRLFMMSAWKNEEGKLMVSRKCRVSTTDSHDYNEEFGNGESFIKTCDWEVILPEWDGYVAKQFDETLVKMSRKDNTYTLEIGASGFPILPDYTDMDSDTRKAVVWAFLNWHYYCSGRTKDPVPWKEVIPWQEELILPPYLPEGRKIWEPSRMNQNEATKLLYFWYDRQQTCWDITFEFYGWWSKADKEVTPPVRQMSLFEDDKPADDQQGKTGKRTGQNPTAMVDDTLDSSDEDSVLAPKKHWNSKSWASSEESTDQINMPDSSDKSSDDEMPAIRKGKHLVKDKTTRLVKIIAPPKNREPATSFQAKLAKNMAKAAEIPQEPSASRVPPTPLDKPRKVGSASRPGSALRSNPGDHSNVVELSSSQESTRHPSLGKRHGAKVVSPESPDRRTRVQTKGKK
ncbi:hypothetical protein F4604DRAFT_1678550 [Suillus subluteus]|nr:hypothetical protein F4604DRAFT_1678550 [Suillus subluteus]